MASKGRYGVRATLAAPERMQRASGDGDIWRALHSFTQDLVSSGGVVAVVLFGSVARSEESPTSDVDLVVVLEEGSRADDARRRIRNRVAHGWLDGRMAPAIFTQASLTREARRRPSFAAHLMDEGVVLYAAPTFVELEDALADAATPDAAAIAKELSDRAAALDRLSDLDRFNGEYVPTLSQLYSLSRSLVISRLLQEGTREFSWRRIFDVLSDRRPELRVELGRLRALRPYFEHVHGRRQLSDPELAVDSAVVQAAIEAVRTVSGANESG